MLHLADGRCNGRKILSESLSRSMRTQQATIHPAVPGWGYAFQLDVDNGRQLAEHGGDIGGFSSLFAVIPEERSAFFIVNHGEGHDLRFRVKRALLDALYPGPPALSFRRPILRGRRASASTEAYTGPVSRATAAVRWIRSRISRSPSVPTACSSFGDRNGCRSSETCSCGRMASGCWASRVTTSVRSPSSAAGRGASPIGCLQRRANQNPVRRGACKRRALRRRDGRDPAHPSRCSPDKNR